MKQFTELAHLSKLSFSQDEEIKIAKDLENIIEFIKPVTMIDLNDCVLDDGALSLNDLRDDNPHGSFAIEQVHMNTRRNKGRFFVTDQVVE